MGIPELKQQLAVCEETKAFADRGGLTYKERQKLEAEITYLRKRIAELEEGGA